MKCDDCLNLLETHLDGEAGERDTDLVRAHLASCANCEARFEALTAENESYARYDREIQISPAVWNGVAARIATEDRQIERESKSSFANWLSGLFAVPSLRFSMPAVALVAIAIVVGVTYLKVRPQPTADMSPGIKNVVPQSGGNVQQAPPGTSQTETQVDVKDKPGSAPLPAKIKNSRPLIQASRPADQPEVLFTDAAYTDMDERDTANHLTQAENLLVSLRNIKYSETDEEVDVSYEKAESRRLLSENVVLRRDAEMAGKFPAKSMLGSLEPFLIDIANLPDKAKPSEVRQITDRVQRTEIVAELRGY